MRQWKKRIAAWGLCAAAAVSLAGCNLLQPGAAAGEAGREAFDEFIHAEFVSAMEDDYLSMHVFLRNPEAFGVDPEKPARELMPAQDEAAFSAAQRELEATRRRFLQFDPAALTPWQQDTHALYSFMLETNAASSEEKFWYMSPGFGTMTGVHTQLPTLFTDYTFYTEQDVADLVTLLAGTDDAIDALLDYTREQQARGTLMMDFDGVQEYCESVVADGMDSAVLAGLHAGVEKLGLPAETQQRYFEQIDEAFETSFLPAYERILGTVEQLRSGFNNEQGLAAMEGGREYYEQLFRYETSTGRAIDEVRRDLAVMADEYFGRAIKLVSGDPALYEAWVSGAWSTGYTDFADMLADLEQDVAGSFPSVGALVYEIAPIDPSIASGGIAAYFNLPPLDGTHPKQIRVNMVDGALDIGAPETFATLAHEGVPGHMYQTQYAYQNIDDPFRNILCDFPAYTEGYATYVELLSYDFLGLPEGAAELQRDMAVYSNCVVALLDIGIHYDGWSREEARDWLENVGLSYSDELYVQLQANPGAFLPYYVGCMEIMNLRAEAEAALGDAFDELAFHTVLLENGAVSMDMLRSKVEAYILAQGGEASAGSGLLPAA